MSTTFIVTHVDGVEQTIKAKNFSEFYRKIDKSFSLKIKLEDGSIIDQPVSLDFRRSTLSLLKSKLKFNNLSFSIKPWSHDVDSLISYLKPRKYTSINNRTIKMVQLGYLEYKEISGGTYLDVKLTNKGVSSIVNAINSLEAKHIPVYDLGRIILNIIYDSSYGLEKAKNYNLIDSGGKISSKLLNIMKTRPIELTQTLLDQYYSQRTYRYRRTFSSLSALENTDLEDKQEDSKFNEILKLLIAEVLSTDYAILMSCKHSEKLAPLLPVVS